MPGRRTVGQSGRDLITFVYDARELTVPGRAIDAIRQGSKGVSLEQIERERGERYGPLVPYAEVSCHKRDGRRWLVLWRMSEPHHALEADITSGSIGEIRALPPEEAWRITLERYACYDCDVRVEGEAPSYPVPSPDR
jgi:hypothetical protein